MTWLRNADEPAERRPIDLTRLIVCAIVFVLLGVWSQSQSAVDVNFFGPLNDLSNNMLGLGKAIYALGSIWFAIAVVLVLLLLRQPSIALRVGLAAGSVWGIAELVNDLLGTHSISGINVRVGNVIATIHGSLSNNATSDRDQAQVDLERRVAEEIARGLS